MPILNTLYAEIMKVSFSYVYEMMDAVINYIQMDIYILYHINKKMLDRNLNFYQAFLFYPLASTISDGFQGSPFFSISTVTFSILGRASSLFNCHATLSMSI